MSSLSRRCFFTNTITGCVALATLPSQGQVFASERQKQAFNQFLLVEGGDQVALDRLRSAALGGDSWSALQFGYINHLGVGGVPIDIGLAINAYQLATPGNDQAKSGITLAAYNLGLIYLWGQHERGKTSPDVTQAIKWLRTAALAMADPYSRLPAAMQLATVYETGFGRQPVNPDEAARWFRVAANAGEPTAQLKIGLALLEGRGVGRQIHEGMAALTRSAGNGSSQAAYELARVYAFGIEGVAQSNHEALFWAIVAHARDKSYLGALNDAKRAAGEGLGKQQIDALERAIQLRATQYLRRHPVRFARLRYNVPLNQPVMAYA